ncbi:hypothetical protein REPUB_Repub08aG0008600 [Reevesia pubescens]
MKRPRIRIVRRSSSNRSYTESSQSGNAEAIANNYDLLIQILVCLPVKSLLRFKSVSKAWSLSSLIPNSLATFFHTYQALSWTKLVLHSLKFLNFINHPSGLKILQSHNGFLLCSSFRDRFRHDYYVYNPTTKQFVTLPPPANQNTLIVFGVNLAFDPTNSPHYKFVFVQEPDPWLDLRDDPESRYASQQIEIYSSRTQSWRLSGNPFIAEVNTGFNRGVFCNGAIHWLTGWGTTSPYFNVEEEKLRELPMPPFPDDWEDLRMYVYFGESRGHLHLIEIYGPRTTQFNVYEIESDYSGWFVKYHIDLDPLTVAFPGMRRTYYDPSDLNYYVFSVLCIVREENDEESVIHGVADS